MLFTLEALEAKHGDALLLHFGTAKKPQLVVIDGGPGGVFAKSLKPRLDEIKQARSPNAPLPIRMLMVSHIDDDHINGVLQLMNKLNQLQQDGKELPYDILTLWHNSFDDILGNEADELTASLQPAVAAAAASTTTFAASKLPVRQDTALVLASVGQGRDLRALAKSLALNVNEGFNKKLVMVPEGKKSAAFKLSPQLTFTVIGPDEERVTVLQEEWDKQIKKAGVAKAADFADESVFNLSSIVVLAKAGTKTMLLTGDARGDHVISGLERAGLMKKGVCHVDVLKLPHHGSDRNVATEFFRRVTADHYVASGDGKHGNPEVATFKMLSEARGKDRFTIHLTHGLLPEEGKPKKLLDFFKKEKAAGKKYQPVFRDKNALSLTVDLGDEGI